MKAGLILLAGTLLGRLFGFARETQIAAAFGAGQMAEAAIITLSLPDLLTNVLLGGALSYALIPEFSTLSRSAAWRLHIQMTAVVGVFFGVVAIILGVGSAGILSIFNQHLPDQLAHQTQSAIAFSVWLMPLIGLTGVATAYLQANKQYLATAFSTSIYNGILVLSLFGLVLGGAHGSELLLLSAAMIAGGLLRYAVLWRASTKLKAIDPVEPIGWLIHMPLLKAYAFALTGSAALLALPLIARIYAAQYGEGALAQFNYASKLIELPLGVAISVISIVALPALSQAHESNSGIIKTEPKKEWQALLYQSLRFSILLSMVIMLPCIWFTSSLAHIAYGWGKMDERSLTVIAQLLTAGLPLLILQGAISITSAALASAKSSGVLAWSGVSGVFVFSVAATLLSEYGKLNTLMYAMVLAYFAVLMLQSFNLNMRHSVQWKSFLADSHFYYPVAAVLATFALLASLFDRLQINHWQGLALAISSMVVLSGAVVAASPEIRRIVRTKLNR